MIKFTLITNKKFEPQLRSKGKNTMTKSRETMEERGKALYLILFWVKDPQFPFALSPTNCVANLCS